jgi:hypothetical protein
MTKRRNLKFQMGKQTEQKKEKIQTVRPAHLDTDLIPTRHLGITSIRHCTLVSTKTYTENPDERTR